MYCLPPNFFICAFEDLFRCLTLASFATHWSWSSTTECTAISNTMFGHMKELIYLLQKFHSQPFINHYPSSVANSHFDLVFKSSKFFSNCLSVLLPLADMPYPAYTMLPSLSHTFFDTTKLIFIKFPPNSQLLFWNCTKVLHAEINLWDFVAMQRLGRYARKTVHQIFTIFCTALSTHLACALSSKVNNNRANGHCYNFVWIWQSWTFSDPYFLLMGHFLYWFSTFGKKMKKIYRVEVWIFCKTLHGIWPLCLAMRQFQMPLYGLRFVKMMAIFEITVY